MSEPAPPAQSAPRSSPRAQGGAGAPAGGSGESAADTGAVSGPAAAGVPAGDLLANQGTAATVISGEELRALQSRWPVETLRGIPGVVVGRTGGLGGFSQVRIRGAEGRHTTVLIDGIEANNPGDGEFDFSNILGGEEIERVEVLRGPQSGLYGSGAIGGVINIVTRSGKGPVTLTTRAETGSFNTRDAAAVLSGGGDKAWGLVGTQTRRTDGYNIAFAGRERDGSVTTSSIVKGGFSPLPGLTIEGVLRNTRKQGDRDEENFEIPGTLIRQTDAPSRFSSDQWLGALEAKLSLLGGAWVQSVRGERKSIVNDDYSLNPAFALFGPLYDRYRANAEIWRYTSTLRLDTPGAPAVRHYLTGLVEQKNEGFVLWTDTPAADRERSTRSFVGEARGEYFGSLFVSASVRHDANDVLADFTTWRTAASLRIPGTPVRLHSSYGTGVKLPSLFEQYGRVPNFFIPNPNLKPESSQGWDAGIELTLLGGRAVLDATWFDAELKDKIRFAPGNQTSINVAGISTRQGVELSARVMPLPGLVIGAAWTHLDALEPNGSAEIRRPQATARLDASYSFDRERARVGVVASYNGRMPDEALRTSNACFFGCFPLTPERVTLNDYWLVSATASYKVTPTVEVFARGENLLDRRYEEVFGFGAPGAAVFGGLRITLQDTSAVAGR
jgi:vitamin B12 transporter